MIEENVIIDWNDPMCRKCDAFLNEAIALRQDFVNEELKEEDDLDDEFAYRGPQS